MLHRKYIVLLVVILVVVFISLAIKAWGGIFYDGVFQLSHVVPDAFGVV